MSFTNFLYESSYKKTITVDEAKELLLKNCNKLDFEHPLWRGMRSTEKALHMKKADTLRKSIGVNGNYYTVIIDHVIGKENLKYTKRSEGIITASDINASESYGYGFAVFPYNTTVVSYIEGDIWHIRADFKSEESIALINFNKLLKKLKINDSSIDTIVNGIYEKIDTTELKDLFGEIDTVDGIKAELEHAFNPKLLGFKHDTMQNIKVDELYDAECWFSDDAIAISYETYESLIKDGFKLK